METVEAKRGRISQNKFLFASVPCEDDSEELMSDVCVGLLGSYNV